MENKKNWKVMLLNIDVVIASAAMVLLVALTFSGVIARYVVGRPFGWIAVSYTHLTLPTTNEV